jgi:nucleotide-binding universal stress UspA family protein
VQRLTLGSQAEAVARASAVPVMLVRLEPAAASGG